MKRLTCLTAFVGLLIGVAGCGTVLQSTAVPAVPSEPQPTAAPSAANAEPTLLPPADTPACPAVVLYYENNAQVELISPAGTRVLIDVYAPNRLSRPADAQDVLLTTHMHGDHVNETFLAGFPGQQLKTQVGEIELADVAIRGIAAAHNSNETPQPTGGSNYIFIVDMGGLRIAHFGDLGQESLTPEQLQALGQVDIAIMQIANPYSSMDSVNKKGFRLMDQVNPRLIIVTHANENAARVAAEKWPGLYTDQAAVSICRADLTAQTRVLFMGTEGAAYGKALNLPRMDQ